MPREYTTILIMAILMTGFSFFSPIGGMERRSTLDISIADNGVALSQIMPRNLRVVVYDEKNTTLPAYAVPGAFAQNGTAMYYLLLDAGFDAVLLDASEISNNGLSTAKYDVLVLPDSLPRENMTNTVREFWLGGGGILSIDRSISFICWAGMLPVESEGNHGYGTYWNYILSDVQHVAARHPTTVEYAIDDPINVTYFDWATFDWSVLSGTADSAHMIKILIAGVNANRVTGVAYHSSTRGGKVVQLPGFGDDISPDIESLIFDSIRWLAPVSKGRIVFDLSHNPAMGVDTWDTMTTNPGFCFDLRNLLVSRMYTFDKLYHDSAGNLTLDRLAPYDILILSPPKYNYTSSEVAAVVSWVSNGGSVWAFGEHGPSPGWKKPLEQINRIIEPMGIEVSLLFGDSSAFYPTPEQHLLTDDCSKLMIAGGGFLNITSPAEPITYHDSNVIAAASQFDDGRVFVLADINWASTHLAGFDNRKLAINVANWLTASQADILLYVDEPTSVNYFRTPVAQALNELGLSHQLVTRAATLNYTLAYHEWDFVIVDCSWFTLNMALDGLEEHIRNGGKLLMSYYYAMEEANHPLWPLLGFVPIQSLTDPDPFYIWDAEHPAFNLPVDYGATKFESTHDYGTVGTKLHLFGNATSFAGYTSLPAANQSLVAERTDGQTIYIGYLIDQFQGDHDDSAYPDNFELWLNLVAYMMRPSVDSPPDVTYTEGQIGKSITWNPVSYHPDRYEIRRNGTIVSSDAWTGSSISISVDGLEFGNYSYVVRAYDWTGNYAENEVLVIVQQAGNGIILDPTLLIIIIVLILILGAALYKKRRSPPPSAPAKSRKTAEKKKTGKKKTGKK